MRLGLILQPILRAVLILLVSMPIVVLLLALETSPSVPASASLSGEERARVERIIVNASPEAPNQAGRHEVNLSASELDLLARYGTQTLNLAPEWNTRLQLQDGSLQSQLSVHLLRSDIPLYLNIDADFTVVAGQLELSRLQAGNLPIPDGLMRFTLNTLSRNLSSADTGFRDVNAFLQTINEVAIADQSLHVVMDWDPELLDQVGQHAQQLFISTEDRRRIRDYYLEISLLAAAFPADLGAVSLDTFLAPLFRSAQQRSLAGGDPIAENRTLLQTLAIYVSDENIEQLLGTEAAADIAPAKFVEVRLHRRQDLARHLVSMAAISASAGASIAEMLSTTKEAYDARYRSGFSFSDLAANTAGTLIGSYATRDADTALIMQQRLANLADDSDYMPEVGNNRDGISEDDFNALYVDNNSPEYQARLAEIEQLIVARPLFQNLP